MEYIFVILVLLVSLLLGLLIGNKIIPPISMVYMTASFKEKEELRNNRNEISFISNVFFMIAICFLTLLLWLIFPNIIAFKVLSYIFIGFVLIYVIYKSILHEMNKDI